MDFHHMKYCFAFFFSSSKNQVVDPTIHFCSYLNVKSLKCANNMRFLHISFHKSEKSSYSLVYLDLVFFSLWCDSFIEIGSRQKWQTSNDSPFLSPPLLCFPSILFPDRMRCVALRFTFSLSLNMNLNSLITVIGVFFSSSENIFH